MVFVCAAFLGILIWVFPLLTGAGPLEYQSRYYPASLAMAGGMAGVFGRPRWFWLWPIGVCIGQFFGIMITGLTLAGPHPQTIFWTPTLGMFGVVSQSLPIFVASGIAAIAKYFFGWKR